MYFNSKYDYIYAYQAIIEQSITELVLKSLTHLEKELKILVGTRHIQFLNSQSLVVSRHQSFIPPV